MDAYLGEIRIFAGNYAPIDWGSCNGTAMSVQQNQPLFALLGVTYGGDGVNTFNLPDLRGRLPISQGTGTGLSPRTIGSKGGTETTALLEANLPAHTHMMVANTAVASSTSPQNNVLANVGTGNVFYEASSTADNLNASTAQVISSAGSNQAHDNIMPFMALNFIICLSGLFPTRN